MSDSTERSPGQPPGYQESMAVLQAYGLDALLTEQDDPCLWAAALRRHWPAPEDPCCAEPTLRFGIGQRVSEGEDLSDSALRAQAASRGMVAIEEWCFERVDARNLRVVRCRPQMATTLLWSMFSLVDTIQETVSGDASPTVPPTHGLFRLDVTRPSQGVSEAVVHAGIIAGPLAGSGEAVLWRRQPDGSWAATDEVVVRWIS